MYIFCYTFSMGFYGIYTFSLCEGKQNKNANLFSTKISSSRLQHEIQFVFESILIKILNATMTFP